MHAHVTDSAVRKTVTGSSQQLGAMVAKARYAFSTTTACYVLQGANPTATAGDGSTLVPAGATIYLDGGLGAKIAVLRATADGECTLTRVAPL